MRLQLTALAAAAAMLASGASWADTKAAEKWVNSEFQPSTLDKKQQLAEMQWFIDAADKLKKQRDDGIVEFDGACLALREDSRFLVRSVAAAFDAHLDGSKQLHSRAV